MKKLSLYLLLFIVLLSCDQEQEESPKEIKSMFGEANKKYLDTTLTLLKENSSFEEVSFLKNNKVNSVIPDTVIDSFGKKVRLYNELIYLFNPDNFDCGCDKKLKAALKKIKRSKTDKDTNGFIPDVVLKNVYLSDDVILIEKGSSVLAHGFQYKKRSGIVSKLLYARDAPTADNFNESEFIIRKTNTYNSFLYTLDCSGYLSVAISAAGGISGNSIKSSANGISDKDKSLLVLGGVMSSPLYQAYKGNEPFSKIDSITLNKRIKILQAILNEIPDEEQENSSQVILNSNYLIILTSNSGKSGFNGEVKAEANAGGNIGVFSGSINGSTNGSINRRSEFTKYSTYIVDSNIDAEPQFVTIGSIKTLITALKTQLNTRTRPI